MRRAGLIILFVAMVFCILLTMCDRAWASSSYVSYDGLESLFLQGQYSAVVDASDNLIRSGYGRKDDIYYLKGLSQLKLNRFADARTSFGYITSNYSRSRRAFDAQLGTGDSYMLEGNLNAAVAIYNGMLRDYPKDKNLPVVYSRLAGCYKGLGLRDKAATYNDMAKRASPLSFEAKGQGVLATQRATVPAAQSAAQSAVQPAAQVSGQLSAQVPSGQTQGTAPSAQLSVQAGSFKSRENASKFAEQLAAAGYESRVEIPVGQQVQLYRVKVGRLASRWDAEALAARLQRDGYKTTICDND